MSAADASSPPPGPSAAEPVRAAELVGRDRTLRRLMRKAAVARLVAAEIDRLGPGHSVVDNNGALIAGEASAAVGAAHPILAGDGVAGRAYGPEARRLTELFGVLVAQEAETRAVARESLDRYKEVTMLYDLSAKIILSPDSQSVASLICEEAEKFLRCDSVCALLLNSETGRLEIAGARGRAFHSRTAIEVGDDILASVLHSGSGEIVNEIQADPRALCAENMLQSVVCSPLKTNARTLGLLVAGTEQRRQFKASDLQILNAVAAQGAAAIEVAQLDRELRATSQKPADLIFGVDDRPPWPVSLALGIQHVLIATMSLAYPVLVTLEAGGSRLEAASVVSMSLIAMAVATVLQGARLGPIGSGFLAPYVTSAIYLGPSLLAAQVGGLGLVFGMTALAGGFGLMLSQLLRRFRKLFPPEVSGVVVLMVGVSMVPIALQRFIGLGEGDALSEPAELAVGVITLGTIIGLTVLPLGRLRLYSTLGGLAVGYGAAAATGLIDGAMFEAVRDLPVVGLQNPPHLYWAFSPLLLLPFLAAALASGIKDAGLIISCQKTNDAGWKRPDTRSVSGGVIAGGIGNIASGLLGGVGVGISAGSIGLAAATGATARSVGLIVGALFLALALMPKATAVVALMPSPVMGAGLLYVACHLVTSGAGLIASRMLDVRRTYVIGLSLLAGVGVVAMPEIFRAAPAWSQSFLGSPLAISTTLAVGLNILLSVGVSSKAQASFPLDERIHDPLLRFFERQGAAWGARSDVVRRAAPAVTEWCEEIAQSWGVPAVTVGLQFDEFRLAATVREIKQDARRRFDAFDGDADVSLGRIAKRLSHRYGCTVRALNGCDAAFEFEH